ncbi:MAG: carboxypeptidase-like regulatory domain-containing protein, partial [Muribaculaceae bacterium]|nr:carboxypeptidase-like regulatory domain-containing protein [Muribaculaceae bacterium]
ILLLFLIWHINLAAFTVYDRETKEPLPYASIYTATERMIGVADENGRFHQPDNRAGERLIVKYIGYVDADCSAQSDSVLMTPKISTLEELVVRPDKTGYQMLCEIKGSATYCIDDEVYVFNVQYLGDFLIPFDKNNKKFKSRTKFRIIDSVVNTTCTDKDGNHLDVEAPELYDLFPVYDLFDIASKNISINTQLSEQDKKLSSVKIDNITGQLRKIGNSLYLSYDFLEDKKEHKWSPNVMKFFGLTTDFTQFKIVDVYTLPDNTSSIKLSPIDYKMGSIALDATFRGKLLKFILNTKNPAEAKMYYEIVSKEIRMISDEESRQLYKTKKQEFHHRVPD